MQIWYNAFYLLIFFGKFYEKWVSVREGIMKLLLETVTYISTTETVICIIAVEIVMCIMNCKRYYLMIATETPTWTISIRIVTHIFGAETFTCINDKCCRNSNCIIATETITCVIATKRATYIIAIATGVETCITSTESVSCIVPPETATCRID